MIAFFVTIYARLLSQRREELFASGDGLEGDDFFFAIIVSGARARARRSTRRIVFTAHSTTLNSYPHERRRVHAEEVHSMRPSQRDVLIVFRFEREADNFLFCLVFRDDILSRGGGWPQKRKSTQITHRNILLFLKRYREQRNVSNRPPSLPPLSLLPPSSPRKPRTRRKTSSRKSRRANRFWSTSRGGLF